MDFNFDLAPLLQNMRQATQSDPNDPNIAFANNILHPEVVGNPQPSYLDQVNQLLAEQKKQEADQKNTQGKWHGFFDNLKNNPTFGQALGVLGQALASPGGFAENLGKGANAVSQIFAAQKERDKAEAEKKRAQGIQELGLKANAMQLDAQKSQQDLSNKFNAIGILSNDKTQRLNALKSYADVYTNAAQIDVARTNANNNAANVSSEIDLRNQQIKNFQQQFDRVRNGGIENGFFKPDANDTPEWRETQSNANALLREKLAKLDGVPTAEQRQKLLDESLTQAMDVLREKKTKAEIAIRESAIGLRGANADPAMAIVKEEMQNLMPGQAYDPVKRLAELRAKMPEITPANAGNASSVTIAPEVKEKFKTKYGKELIGVTRGTSGPIVEYKDADGKIKYAPASEFQ